jgi:hypothetical protein
MNKGPITPQQSFLKLKKKFGGGNLKNCKDCFGWLGERQLCWRRRRGWWHLAPRATICAWGNNLAQS